MTNTYDLPRGSDGRARAFWPDASGSSSGMNLTGYTVDLFDAHPALLGHMTVTLENPTGATLADPASWQIAYEIDWQDDMPAGALMWFILRITAPDGFRQTAPAVTVNVT